MPSQENFLKAMENWANIYFFRSMSEYFDFLKSTGISMQQAYVLTLIYHHSPSKISEICEHMMVSLSAVSQMVDRLEKLALVERTAKLGDRRVRNVVLTAQGESIVRQSIAARQSWVKAIPPELSETQLDQISATLQLLASAYQNEPDSRT